MKKIKKLLAWIDEYPIHPGNRVAIKEKISEIFKIKDEKKTSIHKELKKSKGSN